MTDSTTERCTLVLWRQWEARPIEASVVDAARELAVLREAISVGGAWADPAGDAHPVNGAADLLVAAEADLERRRTEGHDPAYEGATVAVRGGDRPDVKGRWTLEARLPGWGESMGLGNVSGLTLADCGPEAALVSDLAAAFRASWAAAMPRSSEDRQLDVARGLRDAGHPKPKLDGWLHFRTVVNPTVVEHVDVVAMRYAADGEDLLVRDLADGLVEIGLGRTWEGPDRLLELQERFQPIAFGDRDPLALARR